MYFGLMVVNVTKISHKRKNKGLFSIEKYIENEKNCHIIIIRKHSDLKAITSL